MEDVREGKDAWWFERASTRESTKEVPDSKLSPDITLHKTLFDIDVTSQLLNPWDRKLGTNEDKNITRGHSAHTRKLFAG